MANSVLATHVKVIMAESIVASSAATLSVAALDAPVWVMFVGWISFFTRGMNLKQGAVSLVCVLIGVGFRLGAAHAMSALSPLLGSYTVTAVVFAITGLVLSMARVPRFNNLLGFFLGLVAYFASHQPPSLAAFTMIASAATLGTMAAFIAHSWQKRIHGAAGLGAH